MSDRLLRFCVAASFLLNVFLVVAIFKMDANRQAQIEYLDWRAMDKLEWIDLNMKN
jgi:hypothetical protein